MNLMRMTQLILLCFIVSSFGLQLDAKIPPKKESIEVQLSVEKVVSLLNVLSDNYLSGNLKKSFQEDPLIQVIGRNLDNLRSISNAICVMSGLEFILDYVYFQYVLPQIMSFKDQNVLDKDQVNMQLKASENWPNKNYEVTLKDILTRIEIITKEIEKLS